MLYQTNNPHGGDIYGEEIKLDFSANTNPFGTPQGVLDAVRDSLTALHRYPDPYCRKLTLAIAEFEGVKQSHILCGNGAAELIYSYCEAVGAKLAVELAPTFSEYSLGLERTGCKVLRYELSWQKDFVLEDGFLKFLEDTMPDAVFLCNPNNPTGKTIPMELMNRILVFCAEHNIRLFVDECFLDLSDREESVKEALESNPGLLILKAFTKSYGMAGIRLGYCLSADGGVLARMAQAVQPWNVSSLAQAAGIAALREREFLEKTRRLIAAERSWLKRELEKLDFWVCDSEANYLLFRGQPGLHTALRKQKIAVRNCDNYFGLGPGWYRIAVRRREENEALIGAIRAICWKESLWQKTL